MSNPSETCDTAGRTREDAASPRTVVSASGEASGWKHLTRQVPISGQTFCGHSGQDFVGLAGLWHGISCFIAIVCFAIAWLDVAMASA